MRTFLLCVVAVTGMAGCSHSAAPSTAGEPVIASGDVGSRLPDFSVTDLQGHEISSNGLHGKVVLIDFWATWCQPCRKEMPGYQKLVDKYGPRGFIVIGLKFDQMADTGEEVVCAKRIEVRYSVADEAGKLRRHKAAVVALHTTRVDI